MSTFIQIGTNNGNDDFLRKVKKERPTLIILVEPNKEWRDTIRANYAGVSGTVIIKNVAITEKTGDVIKLYIPKVNERGVAKNGYGYNTGNYSILPMDDWGDDLVSIEAPTMTFNDLCDSCGVKNIDYLQLDTEGFDSHIIKMIDFGKYNIRELEYEYWGFPIDRFTKYGDAKEHYGINGMIEAEKILTDLGYEIKRSSKDSLNRVAIKI